MQQSPITAVTAADPYPHYAALAALDPLAWNDELEMWIATNAATVCAVLDDSRLLVRPRDHAVPPALLGTPVGRVFGRLMRMQDGTDHDLVKRVAEPCFGRLDMADVEALSAHAAALALADDTEDRTLDALLFHIPLRVMALLLGCDDRTSGYAANVIGEFMRGLAPRAGPATIARAADAVATLSNILRLLGETGSPLLREFTRVARAADIDAETIESNAIGFLMQSYDATAGLIGNTLVHLGRDRSVFDPTSADVAMMRSVVEEVARYDAPVQNTRRYAAENANILGRTITAGQTILVILAAANRDPAANPLPDEFATHRPLRRTFTFGAGSHACLGAQLAITVASQTVLALLAAGIDPCVLPKHGYHALPNARIPRFA